MASKTCVRADPELAVQIDTRGQLIRVGAGLGIGQTVRARHDRGDARTERRQRPAERVRRRRLRFSGAAAGDERRVRQRPGRARFIDRHIHHHLKRIVGLQLTAGTHTEPARLSQATQFMALRAGGNRPGATPKQGDLARPSPLPANRRRA